MINPDTFKVEMPEQPYNSLINDRLTRLQELGKTFTFLTSNRSRFDDPTYSTLYKNLSAELRDLEASLKAWAAVKAKGENV